MTTTQVVHRSGQLEIGGKLHRLAHVGLSGYSILQMLTTPPIRRRYGVRFRVNDGAYVIDFRGKHQRGGATGTVEWHNRSVYTAPETFWIDRRSATEFSWYRGASGTERIKIADIRFDSDPGPLFVGAQPTPHRAVDNLRSFLSRQHPPIRRMTGRPSMGVRSHARPSSWASSPCANASRR